MRALIYARQSKGSIRSIEEQEVESQALCDRNGWDVGEVVRDVIGASRHSKGSRIGWAKVKKLLPSYDVLVTWESSRAQRDLRDYAELRDLCAANDVVWCYSGRVHDLSKSHDRFQTGLDALLAEREADEIRERVLRATRANAAKGMPHGRRLYGYQRTYDPTSGALTGQIPHPVEADVVRSVFADYVSGRSIHSIEARLDAEGVRTSKGKPWTHWQIRNMLQRPSYASIRVHQGKIVGDAAWEPLVSRETFEKVQARFAAGAAKRARFTATARLLTAVTRCGKCGAKCHVIHDRKKRKTYSCIGCYGTARDMTKLDAYVSGRIIEHLEDGGSVSVDNTALVAAELEVATLRKRLDDAVSQFTQGSLSASTLAKVEADLDPAIRAAEARRRKTLVPVELDLPDGDYRVWWHDILDAEQRRAVVNALIGVVTLLPTRTGTREFDPGGVVVEFAT